MSGASTEVNVPVPLGTGRIAQVRVPWDLSKEEAERISRVVLALAIVEPERR